MIEVKPEPSYINELFSAGAVKFFVVEFSAVPFQSYLVDNSVNSFYVIELSRVPSQLGQATDRGK